MINFEGVFKSIELYGNITLTESERIAIKKQILNDIEKEKKKQRR